MKKRHMRMMVLAIMTVFIATTLFLPGFVCAGSLEPSGPPGSTMQTLDEIYNLIDERCPYSTEAAVPKTGQETNWATGDDGDLEKGVTWPNPRFTDNGNGTVTDNLTGLIWLKDANCFGAQAWTTALSSCNSLASGTCGLTDGSVAGNWRLPNVRELQSLVHYGVYNPAVPNTAGTGKWTSGNPFTGVLSGSNYYWSSSTSADSSTSAWNVNLYDAVVNKTAKGNNCSVWPVRGGN